MKKSLTKSTKRGLTFTLLALFISTAPFVSETAQAVTITLSDMQAVMSSSIDPVSGDETVSLLVDSTLFGTNSIVGGSFVVQPPDPIQPPTPIRWLVDPFGGTPTEGKIGSDSNL